MNSSIRSHRWSIVLAAGSGTRLRSMTTNADGVSVPKQYCAFGSDQTLLERALERARGVTPPGQLVTVVAQQHREHWAPLRSGPDGENVVVQPRNRGTAPGLLLPLLQMPILLSSRHSDRQRNLSKTYRHTSHHLSCHLQKKRNHHLWSMLP